MDYLGLGVLRLQFPVGRSANCCCPPPIPCWNVTSNVRGENLNS